MEDGFVTLKVFDPLGNEIATLVNEVKHAGNYAVKFDASKLPSGIVITSYSIHYTKLYDLRRVQCLQLMKMNSPKTSS